MVRIFDEVDIAHVEGNVDPVRDIEIIHNELRLKDLEMAKKAGDELEKKVVRGNDKSLKGDYVIKSPHGLCLPSPSPNCSLGNDDQGSTDPSGRGRQRTFR